MAIDSTAKRASALATYQPFLRLVVPDGTTDRASALGMFNGFTEGGADVIAPTFSSATIAANGTSITLAFSEAISFGASGNTGFTLTPTNGGAAVTLSYSSGSGTSSLVYTTSRTLSSTEIFTTSYTQPGDGAQDGSANLLATYTAQAVTNNSTQNAAPTDIAISGSTVYTTAGVNAPVGTLSVTDPDASDTATYTLVAGTGDTDNASFNISGSTLRANDPSALGASSRSVRIRATDSAANTREEAFTITVALPANVAVLSGRLQISTGIHI